MSYDITWVTRRQILLGAGGLLAKWARASNEGRAGQRNENVEYGQETLPAGIRSRYIDNNSGVRMHVLEAGFEDHARPCLGLLHGFPELAYTWRNQLLPSARAGFHVVAPDLRGCGRGAGARGRFDDDVLAYSLLNRVSDVLALAQRLGCH